MNNNLSSFSSSSDSFPSSRPIFHSKSTIEFPQMASVKDAAQLSGVPVYRIRRMYKEGKIRYVQCGKRVLINLGSLSAYLERGDSVDHTPSSTGIRRIV